MGIIKGNILITGMPGVGKTTLIKKLAGALKNFHPAGFYTEEIREDGIRKGFALIGCDGRREVLSHTDIESPYRVGKYKVDLKTFNNFLNSLSILTPATSLIIIDEIGKMECLSDLFKVLVKNLLDSEKMVIATIALRGDGFIAEMKQRKDVTLFEINAINRDSIFFEILQAVTSQGYWGVIGNE